MSFIYKGKLKIFPVFSVAFYHETVWEGGRTAALLRNLGTTWI